MEAQVPGARGGDRWLPYLHVYRYVASLWQRSHHEIGDTSLSFRLFGAGLC